MQNVAKRTFEYHVARMGKGFLGMENSSMVMYFMDRKEEDVDELRMCAHESPGRKTEKGRKKAGRNWTMSFARAAPVLDFGLRRSQM